MGTDASRAVDSPVPHKQGSSTTNHFWDGNDASPMPWRLLIVPLVGIAAIVAGCTQSPPPIEDVLPDVGDAGSEENATAVARDLDTVWEIAFAPDDRVFLTERPGRIQVIEDGNLEVWKRLEDTVEQGESGLMGLALHPSFPEQPWVYACQTHRDEEGELRNRVIRIEEVDGSGGSIQPLVEGIDASRVHDGCRIAFGPQGLLYVTMGDAADASRAQDESDLNGKVLRVRPEGQPAGGNEAAGWDPLVFTMGHRNPQGLDFHPDTRTAWISEHGPENHDEVNVLEAGANYGWPQVRGQADGGGQFAPALWSSGAEGTVAPAGAAFIDAPDSPIHGAFVFATLAGTHLHVLETGEEGGEPVVEDEHVVFEESFGRLRALTWGPDEALYMSTSNRDGRGEPGASDDRIVRVPLALLEEEIDAR